jgi:hypothetical protein
LPICRDCWFSAGEHGRSDHDPADRIGVLGAEMSIPWWNEKKPGPSKAPARMPFSYTVRGSPKKPRIGCCRSNGLNGQGYADAPAACASTPTSSATTAI